MGGLLTSYNGTKKREWTLVGQRIRDTVVENLEDKGFIQMVMGEFYEITDMGREVVEKAPIDL